MFDYSFKTITSSSEGLYKEKGSRFIALAYPVICEEDIKKILEALRKQYHDAKHHCYAYVLNPDKSVYRMNDDGEPSATAGKPIFGQINSKDLTNVLVVVIRYFGGVKLGVGGLIQAYKTATKDALEHAEIVTKTIDEVYRITFEHSLMNQVMQILKMDTLKIIRQDYVQDSWVMEFRICKSEADTVYRRLQELYTLKIEFVKILI